MLGLKEILPSGQLPVGFVLISFPVVCGDQSLIQRSTKRICSFVQTSHFGSMYLVSILP